MKVESIRPHILNEYRRPSADDLDAGTRQLLRDDEFRKRYYAFTCLEYSEPHGKLFCGTTNFSLDLLQSFDLETGAFESMRYQDFSEDFYEVKIHRSLATGSDGTIYGATSCLHPEKDRLKAPGGKLFRFDYKARAFEQLAIPKPHDYIQTITLDDERGMIYGFTYPVFDFFAYSLRDREVKYSQYMGSIPHLSVVDDLGGYWGTWGVRSHNFFRYDPATNAVTFHDHGFPTRCQNLMYAGAGPIDGALNIGDGYVYLASEQADLYRLDLASAELTYLGKPFPSIRLPALCLGPDGALYCAGGADWHVRLARYDFERGAFEDLGPLTDTRTNTPCFRAHDCVCVGNRLFVGETDHPHRTNHLWEATLTDQWG